MLCSLLLDSIEQTGNERFSFKVGMMIEIILKSLSSVRLLCLLKFSLALSWQDAEWASRETFDAKKVFVVTQVKTIFKVIHSFVCEGSDYL